MASGQDFLLSSPNGPNPEQYVIWNQEFCPSQRDFEMVASCMTNRFGIPELKSFPELIKFLLAHVGDTATFTELIKTFRYGSTSAILCANGMQKWLDERSVKLSPVSTPRLLSCRQGGPSMSSLHAWQSKFCIPDDVLTTIAAVAVEKEAIPQQKSLMDQVHYIVACKPSFTLSEYAMLLYQSDNINARKLGEEIYNSLDQ